MLVLLVSVLIMYLMVLKVLPLMVEALLMQLTDLKVKPFSLLNLVRVKRVEPKLIITLDIVSADRLT